MNNAGTINIKINGNRYIVPADITILDAAKSAGIYIPTLCFLDNYPPHTSCYLCLVKIAGIARYMPACATKVVEGGDYTTDSDDIRNARRDALELLLSEHRGDCIAPCRIACPTHMNIPEMMFLINNGQWDKAIQVIKKDIAMPAIFGRICPAYCEKACKRKQFDDSLSICSIKRIAADVDFLPVIIERKEKVAVIGGGISGLTAAFHLRCAGYNVNLFEKNKLLSKLRLKYSDDILPVEIIELDIDNVIKTGINVIYSDINLDDKFISEYDAVLLAIGLDNDLIFDKDDKGHFKVNDYQLDKSGLFACGSAVIGSHEPVRAMASGRFAAEKINHYLIGEYVSNFKLFSTRLGQLTDDEKDKFLSLWKNITGDYNIKKVDIEDKSNAELESGRCLQCSCLKLDSCDLRTQAICHEANTHKYEHDHSRLYKVDFSHKDIIFESAKCIKCGICISISKDDNGSGLSFVNRGYIVEPAVPFDRNINLALVDTALECADNCPTGAISRRRDGTKR